MAEFMAPEVIGGAGYQFVDIYALKCVTLELVTCY